MQKLKRILLTFVLNEKASVVVIQGKGNDEWKIYIFFVSFQQIHKRTSAINISNGIILPIFSQEVHVSEVSLKV
jgi:hypothetical protein